MAGFFAGLLALAAFGFTIGRFRALAVTVVAFAYGAFFTELELPLIVRAVYIGSIAAIPIATGVCLRKLVADATGRPGR